MEGTSRRARRGRDLSSWPEAADPGRTTDDSPATASLSAEAAATQAVSTSPHSYRSGSGLTSSINAATSAATSTATSTPGEIISDFATSDITNTSELARGVSSSSSQIVPERPARRLRYETRQVGRKQSWLGNVIQKVVPRKGGK